MERILYGGVKTIAEHIELGSLYSEVKKVYSISILYFDIGKGNDYLYHGQNIFTGVHTGDRLQEARKKLIYYNMDSAERNAYDRHVDAIMIQNDVIGTAKLEGLAEGRAEGRQEGERAKQLEIARNLKRCGVSLEVIAETTGLSLEEINKLE